MAGTPQFFSDAPPPAPRWYRILSPKAGEWYEAICLSDRPLQAATHWIDKRTIPHVEPATVCRGCQAGQGVRRKGYFAILWGPNRRLALAELTHDALRTLDGYDWGRPGGCRGRVLRWGRPGRSPNAKVQAYLKGYIADLASLPAAFDVGEALRAMWDAPSREERNRPDPNDADAIDLGEIPM